MVYLSVVIPLLNEEKIVEELIKRVIYNTVTLTEEFEIILVDDGSKDLTWKEISNICLQNSRVKGIRLSRNFGHHFAITAGLESSSGQWVIVMDGDLQDNPELIPKLYEKSQEGFDIVFVSRETRNEHLMYRIMQYLFYKILNFLTDGSFDSSQANYSIISRKVVDAFKSFREQARFYGSTIKWLGFKRSYISAKQDKRYAGKASYSVRKRFNLALDIIISFSEKPLKIAVAIGLFFSVVSISFSLYLLIRYLLWGFEVLGWTSLIITIVFMSGIIITFLGVLGTYLGSIFREVKGRPLYVEREKINFG